MGGHCVWELNIRREQNFYLILEGVRKINSGHAEFAGGMEGRESMLSAGV